eukprot:COSAG01_NODE_9948_length_2294_cov_5.096128_1_plen_463_part_00
MAGSENMEVWSKAINEAFFAPVGDKCRPSDEQLVAMSWRLAKDMGVEPPLTQGYDAAAKVDSLRVPTPLPEGVGQAAQDFLRVNWNEEAATPWRKRAQERTKQGLSGILGLPNSSQQACNLCLLCVRRPGCAAVGKFPVKGFITQRQPQGHLGSKTHKNSVEVEQAEEKGKQAGKRARDEELAAQPILHRAADLFSPDREAWDELMRKREKRRRTDEYRVRHGGERKNFGPGDINAPSTQGRTHSSHNSSTPTSPPDNPSSDQGEDAVGGGGNGGGGIGGGGGGVVADGGGAAAPGLQGGGGSGGQQEAGSAVFSAADTDFTEEEAQKIAAHTMEEDNGSRGDVGWTEVRLELKGGTRTGLEDDSDGVSLYTRAQRRELSDRYLADTVGQAMSEFLTTRDEQLQNLDEFMRVSQPFNIHEAYWRGRQGTQRDIHPWDFQPNGNKQSAAVRLLRGIEPVTFVL